MEILPAWLIEEIEKMEELKRRQSERSRLYIEMPAYSPLGAEPNAAVEEKGITIPLR